YLTAFPDYKLPQILNHWKVMEYSPKLAEKIKLRTELKPGSNEEVEIRSATVWAVEYINEELKARGVRLKSFEIDWLLWNESKRIEMSEQHHLTTTIFY
ncbi:MAG: queuosine salvage family protein, partial [Patescibacteria group bacterium]